MMQEPHFDCPPRFQALLPATYALCISFREYCLVRTPGTQGQEVKALRQWQRVSFTAAVPPGNTWEEVGASFDLFSLMYWRSVVGGDSIQAAKGEINRLDYEDNKYRVGNELTQVQQARPSLFSQKAIRLHGVLDLGSAQLGWSEL